MALQQIPIPLPVIGNDIGAPIVLSSAVTWSGDCTSLGEANTYSFQLSGTWVATLEVQITLDSINWVYLTGSESVLNVGTQAYQASGQISNTNGGNGIYVVNVPGMMGARVVCTAWTSGTVAGVANLTAATGIVALSGLPQVIATTPLGSFTTLHPTATGNGCTPWTATIGNTPTAVKAAAGQVYGWQFFNPNTSAVYVQFFNTLAANVTLGTTVPFKSIGIGPGMPLAHNQPNGVVFSTALSVAVTTAPGLGAANPSSPVTLDIEYA